VRALRPRCRIEFIWSQIYDHSFWTKGGGAISFAALSAIEQALWDIKGKRLGVPVYEMLGGRVHDRLRAYANGWCMGTSTVAEFLKAAEMPLRDGFKAIKCYPLASTDAAGRRQHIQRRQLDKEIVDRGVEKIRRLRELAGQDIEIMLDLSGGLFAAQTEVLLDRFSEFSILFVEEPTDPFDIGALKLLADKSRIPLAAGERLYGKGGFRRVVENHSLSYIQPDVGTCGGLLEMKRIAGMAEAYNIGLAPHNSASSLSTAATLQIDACTTNFVLQEIRPYERRQPGYVDVLVDNPESTLADGYFAIPQGVGLCATLNEVALADFVTWRGQAD
jgi:galactonate dehydratase